MIKIEKILKTLPFIKSNETIISPKRSFHLSLYVALVNADEKKCYETFHTFKLSLGSLNLVMNVNRSDFNIFKQILPVTV